MLATGYYAMLTRVWQAPQKPISLIIQKRDGKLKSDIAGNKMDFRKITWNSRVSLDKSAGFWLRQKGEGRETERGALFEHDQIFKRRLNGADPSGNKAFKIPFGLAREC